jgi:integrase
MASIQKHKKGYRAQISILGTRDSSVFPTKREAESWAARRETEIRADAKTPAGSKHTLLNALHRYAENESATKRGERWEILRLKAFESHNLPINKKIGEVGTDDLAAWRDTRLKTVKPATVLREINLLGSVFEAARREWKWIDKNPVRDLRKPSSPAHREVVITPKQIRQMLRSLGYVRGQVRSVSQAVACCFLVALRTGMRASELCNLTWDRVHNGYCTLPMTKNGKARDVPLTPKALAIIRSMDGFDPVRVFGITPQTLDALFRRARGRAELTGFTFHDSRHTAATWIAGRMQSKGIAAQQAVFDLCKMFGWTKIDQALVYYNASAADIAKRIT